MPICQAWGVHIPGKDKDAFLTAVGRTWDMPVDIFTSQYPGRILVFVYPTEDFKSFAKLKFDIIEHVRNTKERW